MIVVGFDPGIATSGYGVISLNSKINKIAVISYGVIKTEKNDNFSLRLSRIYDEVDSLITHFKPDYAGVEKILFSKNTKTAIEVAQSLGVIKLACARKGLTVKEYTPLEVKKSVLGYGRADKIQIQRALTKITNIDKIPGYDDAADALVIAICCGLNLRTNRNLL
ncbi:MAG: crossover junction endodeoxyribonuclease RuvC [Candidatus Hydrogenedentota bacterium]